ncbi:coiled-coil domain-containing protein 39-like [Neltuma alba]|uniref:coiled-coil domain-containing protein 39-like n=1 Tax=Neltuma alba TaxID=207710 RepID=UPI0010A5170F|nr:coiled-coil domain-containing protein 39-like [Prosopis alba]
MGRALSLRFRNIFRPKKLRYHRISNFSDSQTQPLLENHNQFKEAELEHDVQASWEKLSALEKEIGALKSNLSRLETKLQIKAKEGNNQHEAITSLEQKVDKLKKRLDDQIILAQTKAKEASDRQETMTSLEQRVDKLKNYVDGIILGHEYQRKMNSNEILKQEGATITIEENNSNMEKKVAELETRVNEMTSSMIDMIADISEPKDKYSSNPQELAN